MSNAILYEKGSDSIHRFLSNAWIEGNRLISETGNSVSFKRSIFDVKWTNDVANPIRDGNGKIIGWDKKPSEMADAGGIEIAKSTHSDRLDAYGRMEQIASMTYAQVEAYVDANVTDLASARNYLKLLSKVVLGLIKITR